MTIEEYLSSDSIDLVRIGFELLNQRKDISVWKKGRILKRNWLYKGMTIDFTFRVIYPQKWFWNLQRMGSLQQQPWYWELYLITKELLCR